MTDPNPLAVRKAEDTVLQTLTEVESSLTNLYTHIAQQLAAQGAKLAAAQTALDAPSVVVAFPSDHAWRTEVERFQVAVASFSTLMATVPDAPRIGE